MIATLLTFVILLAGALPPTASGDDAVVERRQLSWPGGGLRLEATYRDGVYHGEYRTWYESGQPYELRHFESGRESGLQRSWTPDGELYLNYEVRNGRRYGYINARPCLPVTGGQS